ncbi:hypothetical protein GCM10009663_57560 [Kitasatospora arboriphila]|uniref:ATP-binding protein n=2 Tax=Kitasatospora arboriphila TaxID=258052 RepID=A0ABP4EJU6_9ACTN
MMPESGEQHEEPVPHQCQIIGQRTAFGLHSFKDRVRELPEIRRLLQDPAVRIISLLGRRGIGKSLLAVRAATSAADGKWPDGARTKPLDAVVYLGQRTSGITFERVFFDCLSLLSDEKAARLHRTWASGRRAGEKASALFDALAPREVLLLFDNLEDVLDVDARPAEPELGELIEALVSHERAPRLLLTSQIPLSLSPQLSRAEHRVELRDGLPDRDAVSLLRELDPYGHSGIREADEELLAATARRVYGVPRGLELIAGALRDDLTMRTLREWLTDSDALTNVVDQLAHRHYEALSEEPRLVVDVLSVFGTPTKLEAIEWVLQPVAPALEVREVLRKLIDSYLVRQDRQTRSYSLHPMDADIARNSLRSASPSLARRLHRRIADWYARTATSPETWQSPLDVDPNRRELEHRIQAGDYDEAALVLDQVAEFLLWQGSVAAVLGQHSRLVGLLGSAEARLAHLVVGGHAHYIAGPQPRARELLEQAAALATAPQHRARLQRILFLLGDLDRFENRPEAILRLTLAAELASELGNVEEVSHSLMCLSLAHSYAGRPEQALETAAELANLTGEPYSASPLTRARLGDALACAYVAQRNWTLVAEAISGAIAAYRESGIPEALGYAFNTLGLARCAEGDLAAALEAFEQGVVLGAETEMARAEGLCFFNRAWVLWETGRCVEAEESARAARAAYRRGGCKDEPVAAALCDALAEHRRHNDALTVRHLERCEQLLDGNPDLCPSEWLIATTERIRNAGTGSL